MLKLVGCICFVTAVIALADKPAVSRAYLEQLIVQAKAAKLHEEKQWKRILFILPGWWNAKRSLIKHPSFFLSPDGVDNPARELEATLRAFFELNNQFDNSVHPPINLHAQCRFPARFFWLNEKLSFDKSQMPFVQCERLEGFLADVDAERVSLVFSSGFLSSPASMFGHTLLRFHKRHEKGAFQSPLLDHAASFAAYPDTNNPFLYAARGLSGGFPGLFDFLPYYLKIQQYNNQESRDLWEYELSLDEKQVGRMIRSLWEVTPYPIPYYYLDHNCASLLLVLIDIGNPEYNLAEDFFIWVTPGDIVRAIHKKSSLITNIRYSPSSLSRYMARHELLRSDHEREVLYGFMDDSKHWEPKLRALAPEPRARVLDAVVELIDYKEKLAGSERPARYASLRNESLTMRSETPIAPEPLPPPASNWDPRKAHGSVRLTTSIGSEKGTGPTLGISWRPALHDVAAQSFGYSEDLEIRFLDVSGKYALNSHKLWLSQFLLFDVLSLSAIRPMIIPLSWRASIAMEEDVLSSASHRAYRKYARLGVGLSSRIDFGWQAANKSMLYALAILDLGSSQIEGQSFHLAPGIQAGMVILPVESLTIMAKTLLLQRFGRISRTEWNVGLEAAFHISQDDELRLHVQQKPLGYEVYFSYCRYFWHFW